MGGIAGVTHSSASYTVDIKNCANYETILNKGKSTSSRIGGIVGNTYSGGGTRTKYITNCYNWGMLEHSGTTTSDLRIGGITGHNYYTEINYCLSTGWISLVTQGSKNNAYGSIVGKAYSGTYIYNSIHTDSVNYNTCGSGDVAAISESPNWAYSSTDAVYTMNNMISSRSDCNKWLINANNNGMTFVINNGGGFYRSSTILLLPTLATGEYGFDGWYTSTSLSTSYTSTEVTGTTTVYGGWSVKVTYDGNGGSPSSSSRWVTCGGKYGSHPSASRTGYSFDGWYTSSYGGTWVTSSTIVPTPKSHTLCAHWTIRQFTITFNSNGGSECSLITKNYGSSVTLPTPTREGYKFDYWCSNQALTSRYTGTTMPANNVYLYAKWTINQYNVSFMSNGTIIKSDSLDYAATITYPSSPSRTGYTFVGWDRNVTATPAYDLTINARYIPNNYTITFYSNGGSECSPITQEFESGLELPKPNKTGYTLESWCIDADLKNPFEHTTMPAENVYLYAKWTINQYNVSFMSNGTIIKSDSLDYTATITYPSSPSRTGYTFVGWDSDVTATPAYDLVINAQWNPNVYIVEFDENGGDDLDNSTMNVTYDELYGELPEPTRTGYTFIGWFNNETADEVEITSDCQVDITESIILYAYWAANNYTVTFNATEYDTLSEQDKEVTYDELYGELPEPTRAGYTFLGWFTEEEAGEQVTSEVVMKTSDDHTLYAHWKVNMYTVTFDATGGTSSEPSKIYTYDEAYKGLPDATRTGYTFLGWFTEEEAGEQVTSEVVMKTPDDHTLYAHWNPIVYTVDFDENGEDNVTLSKDVTYDAAYGELPGPTMIGYTFLGWFTEEEEGYLIEEDTTVRIAEDHTLYAHWNPNVYVVDFDENGGDGLDNSTKDVTYDAAYGELPEPTRAGYTFLGWFTEEDEGYLIEEDTTVKITEDHTLYAHWGAANYTVTFVGNGGVVEISSKVVYYGGSYEDLPEPTKSGYVFLWWYRYEDAPEKVTRSTIVKTSHDHMLYAQWDIVTVTFDPMGGKAEFVSMNVSYYSLYYGELPGAERIGHTFIGWFTSEEGQSGVATGMKANNADHTLYAHWSVNNYTLTFLFGNCAAPDVRVLDFNTSIDYPENVEKTGYTFRKWDQGDIETVPDHNVTFTAVWEANTYTVSFNTNGGSGNDEMKSKNVTFDDVYGDLPVLVKKGHTFTGWFAEEVDGEEITSKDILKTAEDHTLYARWDKNSYVITFDFGYKKIDETYLYDDLIDLPETDSKPFYNLEKWCTEDEKICLPANTPDSNATFVPFFAIDPAAVAGTAIGSFAGLLLLILLIILLLLVAFMVINGLKVGRESFDVEMSALTNSDKEEEEKTRIIQQMEVTEIMDTGMQHLLSKYLNKIDREKPFFEILDDFDITYDDDNNHNEALESFKIIGVIPFVANSIQSKTSLVYVTEYLSLLYTTARMDEEFQEFGRLYFGMKNMEEFSCEKDEHIKFGGIVSAFTDKKKVIQFMSENEEDGMPKGVLFSVHNGKGYKTGALTDGTDEILFEIDSDFVVKKVEEVIKGRYVVVKLLFISPDSKDDLAEL